MRTVVGLYDDFNDAQQVIRELTDAGFDRSQINLVARDAKGDYSNQLQAGSGTGSSQEMEGAGIGAGAGAVLGGLGGLLLGLGALLIPGVGPVIAAGPILSALAGAGIGAVAGGLVGALVENGVPEENARDFAEGVRRGGSLVTLHVDEDRVDQAVEIFNRHNPVNLRNRAQMWHTENAPEDRSKPWDADQIAAEQRRIRSEQIPVTGGQEQNITGQSDLSESGGAYTYPYGSSSDQSTGSMGTGRTDYGTTGDRSTDPMGLGGSNYGTTSTYGTDGEETGTGLQGPPSSGFPGGQNPDLTTDTSTTPQDFQRVEPMCQMHFEKTYMAEGHGYEYYRPAYYYGYEMAYNPRYQGKSWSDIEQQARQDWESRSEQGPVRSSWEDVKDAVRAGWESITQ